MSILKLKGQYGHGCPSISVRSCTTYGIIDKIEKGIQNIKFSGVGAHHQNGTAKYTIQIILTKARSILIHTALQQPCIANATLWPMAVVYAEYHHNHCPRLSANMVAPIDLVMRTTMPRSHLHDMHVWGCLCYVSEPTLQVCHNLPKWKPLSYHTVFLFFSPQHSSRVP